MNNENVNQNDEIEKTIVFDPNDNKTNEPKSNNNKIVIIIITLVLLVIIGVGTFFLLRDDKVKTTEPSIVLTKKEANLGNNETIDLKDYLVLENVNYDDLDISVNDNDLVIVDGSKLTSKRTSGTLDVIIKYNDQSVTLKININVGNNVSFKSDTITLEQNASFDLKDYLDLVNVSFDELEITISNDNLANLVDNKIFTKNSNGEFTINVKYNDLSSSLKVIVKTKTDIEIVNDAIENMLSISYGYNEKNYSQRYIVDRLNNRIVTTNTDCNDIINALAYKAGQIENDTYLKTKIEIDNVLIDDLSEVYKFLYNNIDTIEKISDNEYRLTVKNLKRIADVINHSELSYITINISENRINSIEFRHNQTQYNYFSKAFEYFYDIPSNTDIYVNNAVKCANNYNTFMAKQFKTKNITLNGKQHELKVQYNIETNFEVGPDRLLFANVYLDNKLIANNNSTTEYHENGGRGIELNFNTVPTYDITKADFFNNINTILEQNQILKGSDGKEYLVQHMYNAGISCFYQTKMAIIDDNGNTLTTILTDSLVVNHDQPLFSIHDNYITYTDVIIAENPLRISSANEYKLTINNGQIKKEYISDHRNDGTITIEPSC